MSEKLNLTVSFVHEEVIDIAKVRHKYVKYLKKGKD